MKYFIVLSVLIGCAKLVVSDSSSYDFEDENEYFQSDSIESTSRGDVGHSGNPDSGNPDNKTDNNDHNQIDPKLTTEPYQISPTNGSTDIVHYTSDPATEVERHRVNSSGQFVHAQGRLANEAVSNQTGPTTNLSNPCDTLLDAGPCVGKFLKFYFDKSDQRCKAFFYGGCYGNANHFQTVEECEFICIENSWPPYPINNQTEGNKTETKVYLVNSILNMVLSGNPKVLKKHFIFYFFFGHDFL